MKKFIILTTIIFVSAGSMLSAMDSSKRRISVKKSRLSSSGEKKQFQVKRSERQEAYSLVLTVSYKRSPFIFQDYTVQLKIKCGSNFSRPVSELRKIFAQYAGKSGFSAELDPQYVQLTFNDRLLLDGEIFYCTSDSPKNTDMQKVCDGVFTVKNTQQTMFDANF
ncbi:MAG TPA: hypothetical protein VKR54_02115 [Candidatus Babeliales bacterium]|jgi:hypothetical protein|nr:hypothetical protein [Candidatus Babeliales bacterium]